RSGVRDGRRPYPGGGKLRRDSSKLGRSRGLYGPATMRLLDVAGVVAGYSSVDEIVKGVDLMVDRGEIVAIIGPNGAGKSTLLKAIAGILKLKAGSVTLAGMRIDGRPAREISTLGIAFVPQEHNIFPTMSVAENLEIGGY